MKELEKKS